MRIFSQIQLDAWISVVLLIVSVYLFRIASDFPVKAALFPNVLLLSTIALCCVVIIQSIRREAKPKESAAERHSGKQQPVIWAITVYCMIAAYFMVWEPLGFLLSTMIFVSGAMLYFGERNWLAIVGAGVGLNVFVYLTFVWFLEVPLPMLPVFFE